MKVNKFFNTGGNTYGQRAALAASNQNIDWKAISHALRAGYQIEEIFTKGTISYPLCQAQYLKDVKLGRLDYLTEVAPTLEALMDKVEGLAKDCGLPEEPDFDYWDDFLCQTVEKFLLGQKKL